MLKTELLNKSRAYFKPKSNIPAFLIKTYDILENPSHSDIISWNREGTAFIVKNINDFSEKILPKYFKHNNFSSFVRQLNMYDFHKSKQDGKENEFKHKLFRRGQRHLLSEIKRKGTDHHASPDDQSIGSQNSEINKMRKSANLLNEELTSVKSQQGELEKLGKMIYTQNTQLLNENKVLWDELNKNKDKYDKKVEKLMMFAYVMVGQNGKEALGSVLEKKQLPSSESTDALKPNLDFSTQEQRTPSPQNFNILPLTPDKKNRFQTTQHANKPKSPPLLLTPTGSNVSTVPNTPGNILLMGNPSVNPLTGLPITPKLALSERNIQNTTYHAQPYFSNQTNTSPTGQPSDSYGKSENLKLTRPVPSMDASESQEYKENPTKAVKKENGRNGNCSKTETSEDPLKLEEWPFPLSLSRGNSQVGDFSFSGLNNLNGQSSRIPSSLDVNFSNRPMFAQNLQSNGSSSGLNIAKTDSDILGKFDPSNGEENYFSPSTFMRNVSATSGYNFGPQLEDSS